jgi:hypothetical protein
LTKEEKGWFESLHRIGCIVCHLNGIHTPPDIHHILANGRRQSHLMSIPLCYAHHRMGINNKIATSRHPFKREFEKRYGTEHELYEHVKRILG